MTSIEKINYQLTLHGMSGAELCRGIGLSNGIYSQWNKNRVIPSNKTLGKIANFLNIPVESILPDEETQPPETERLRNTISEILNGLTNEANGNPLQYSCLENPRDGGAWWAAVYGVAQSWTEAT